MDRRAVVNDAADPSDDDPGSPALAGAADAIDADGAADLADSDAGSPQAPPGHAHAADRGGEEIEYATATSRDAHDLPLSSSERAIVVAAVIMGFVLIALGIALS